MNDFEKITNEMMQVICDKYCKYPYELDENNLENKCDDCDICKYLEKLEGQYEKINRFDQSQSYNLLVRIAELEEVIKNGK